MWTLTQFALDRLFQGPALCGKNGTSGHYFDLTVGELFAEQLKHDMRPWSSGEQIMASLALELRGNPPDHPSERFDVYSCATRLSNENLMACVEAIAIRGGALEPNSRFVPRRLDVETDY